MSKKFRRGRPVKLSLLAALCAVILLGASSVLYVRSLRDILRQETEDYLTEITDQCVSALHRQIQGDQQTLQGMAAVLGARGGLENPEETLSLLYEENSRNPFKQMGFALPDGVCHFTDGTSVDISRAEYFQRALNGERVLSGIRRDPKDGERILVNAAPIQLHGTTAGVLLATHALETYEKMLSAPTFDGAGYNYIVTAQGEVVVNNAPDGRVPELAGERGPLPGAVMDDGCSAENMLEDMRTGTPGMLSYTLEGTHYFMNYAPITMNGWYILSVVPSSALSQKTTRFIWWTLLLCVVIVCLFAGLLATLLLTQRRGRRRLTALAYDDPVTGCYNAKKFSIVAQELLQNSSQAYALVTVDINGFKFINDLYGREVGDRTLCRMAETFRILTEKKNELFARGSADAFLLLLCYNGGESFEERMKKMIEQVARRAAPSDSHVLTLSCGIFPAQADTASVSVMVDRADLARKRNKDQSGNMISFYDESLHRRLLHEKEIENEMDGALRRGEFRLYLQPKFLLSTGTVAGAEALVRWKHPKRGIVPPDVFIPLFERNGFILKLDMYMLEQTCRLLRYWMDKGLPVYPIAVNQSRLHLHSPGYIQTLRRTVDKYGIPPHLIELELTESVVLENVDILRAIFDELHRDGFVLSMDDFGSGYSSLNLLKDIPVDVLKLDRVFLQETADNRRGRAIVAGIVSIARELEMQVVCEGVETPAQAAFLREVRCDLAQGFLYARPIPEKDFTNRYLVADAPTS